MKIHLVLIPAFLLTTSILKGQNDTGRTKEWSLGISMNSVNGQLNQFVVDGWGRFAYTNVTSYYAERKDKSFSISIIPQVDLRHDLFGRCEIGYTSINWVTYYNGVNDSGATGANENFIKRDTLSQSFFKVNPGIFFRLNQNRLSFYGGFTANLTFYGESKWVDHMSAIDVPGSNETWRGTTRGGYSIGFGVAGGFNVRLFRFLSAGGEISTSAVYYNLGGVHRGTHYTHFPPQSPTTRNWSIANNKSRGFQFTKIIPSICVKINF